VRILVDYRPALRQRTGVGEYVDQTARALVATAPPGEHLTLFSSSWKDRLAPDVVPGAAVIDRAVPVRGLNFAWHRLGWPRVETLARARFDVVQASHPLLIPSSAARLVTIYDLDFLDHPERTRAEIPRDYPRLAAEHARRADQIIVISRHTADAVETRLQVPRDRISICVPGGPSWTRRETEPVSGGYILFLGTLEPRKNLGVLLDAYARLRETTPGAPRLVLAGATTPASAPLLERLAAPPLAGFVDLPGYIDAADRERWYRGALVFVLPSHTEGFGLPVVEAMTVGVPVIAANRGAVPEAAGDAGVLVNPDDPTAIAAAIERLLHDVALRNRLRDAGWRQAARFQWTATARAVRSAWSLAREHRRAVHG
jgi:glycosyltransferase involved in cell wall biosynthesis